MNPMPWVSASSPDRARRFGAAVALGLLLAGPAACGDLPEPDLGSPPATPAGEVILSVPPLDAGRSNTDVANGPGDDSPPRPDGYVAEVIAVTGSLVLTGPVEGIAALGEPLVGLPVSRAVDDYFGGLVVQVTDGRVLWFTGEGGTGEVINADADGNPLGRLLDVGFNDGTPEAVLSLGGGSLVRVQLATGEQSPLITLGEGQSMVDLSASTGIFALTYTDEDCGGILLFTSTGEPVEVATPSRGECSVPGRPTFDEVAFGPEGDAYVYTEVAYRADGVEASTTLVARELSSRAELFRVPVGDTGDRIKSLAFDGRRVLFLRSSLNEGTPVGLAVIDVGSPDAPVSVGRSGGVDLEVTGAAFARRPLAFTPAAG